MAAGSISALPIQLATRLVLDAISYSNPLPPWSDPSTVDYTAREEAIARKIEQYLNGARPKSPFEILVPKKAGVPKAWIVPSVNDQIVLQTSVSALAEKVDKVIDPKRVLSYRYNTDPNRLQLTNSQISSWSQFQSETQRRLDSRSYLLQLDLEQAFRSVNRPQFLAFVEDLSPHSIEVELLKVLLESFGAPDRGLPLINDSLFFMGNAYLSVVDQVIRKHAADFIRFVDDYRIFGESKESLEEILMKVTRDLPQMGFKINNSKVKLGSSEEYLDAIAKVKYATTEALSGRDYISAAIFDDVIEPKQMVELVARVVGSPDEYLNEGFGRLTLGAIRRMRFNAVVAMQKNYFSSPREKFTELLSNNASVVGMAVELLQKYAQTNDEVWRTAWLLFVMDDMDPNSMKDKKLVNRMKETVKVIRTAGKVPLITRLWANKLWSEEVVEQRNLGLIDEVHDLSYLEAGVRCYGETHHA